MYGSLYQTWKDQSTGRYIAWRDQRHAFEEGSIGLDICAWISVAIHGRQGGSERLTALAGRRY